MNLPKMFNINAVEWQSFEGGIRYCVFQPTPEMTIQYTEIPAGASLAMHEHEAGQMTYIQEGFIEMILQGELYQFGPGSMCMIPPNAPHAVRNVGQTTVTAIDVFSPARPERVESEAKTVLAHHWHHL